MKENARSNHEGSPVTPSSLQPHVGFTHAHAHPLTYAHTSGRPALGLPPFPPSLSPGFSQEECLWQGRGLRGQCWPILGLRLPPASLFQDGRKPQASWVRDQGLHHACTIQENHSEAFAAVGLAVARLLLSVATSPGQWRWNCAWCGVPVLSSALRPGVPASGAGAAAGPPRPPSAIAGPQPMLRRQGLISQAKGDVALVNRSQPAACLGT